MSEWSYAHAGQIPRPNRKLWLNVSNRQLHIPIEAYCSSMERLREFWQLAPHMMEVTAANLLAQHEFIFEAGKTYQVPPTEEEFNKLMVEEITKRVAKKYKQTGSLREATGYDIERGIKAFDGFLRHTTSLDGAVRAILESQITLSWTAFEALAEDLWNAALACHPGSATQKPHFRRLQSIRESYESLSPTSNEINAVLANPDLRKLNLVRNVLIHKAGIVDQQFLDGAGEIGWNSGNNLGQLIRIDGARVKELVSPLVQSSERLIRSVDKWITAKRQNH